MLMAVGPTSPSACKCSIQTRCKVLSMMDNDQKMANKPNGDAVTLEGSCIMLVHYYYIFRTCLHRGGFVDGSFNIIKIALIITTFCKRPLYVGDNTLIQ